LDVGQDPFAAPFHQRDRASDRVSQFLIRHVIYAEGYPAEDTVFRTLLFKIFNKIETWQLLCERIGDLPNQVEHHFSAAIR
jgi:hypothetical protein